MKELEVMAQQSVCCPATIRPLPIKTCKRCANFAGITFGNPTKVRCEPKNGQKIK